MARGVLGGVGLAPLDGCGDAQFGEALGVALGLAYLDARQWLEARSGPIHRVREPAHGGEEVVEIVGVDVPIPVPEHRRARRATQGGRPGAVVHVQAGAGGVPAAVIGLPVDAELGEEIGLGVDPCPGDLLADDRREVLDVPRRTVEVGHGEVDVGAVPGARVAVGSADHVTVRVDLLEVGGHLGDPRDLLGRRGHLVPELPGEEVGGVAPPRHEVT